MTAVLLRIGLLIFAPPLLLGVIAKTKAWFAGRSGPSLFQPYHDLYKLLGKGAVYSRGTSWVLRAGPIVALATAFVAGLLVPLESARSPLAFSGDVLLFVYALGLGRFFTMIAAMDTGSAFEGMGASREAAFSALSEPPMLLALAIICVPAGSASFGVAWRGLSAQAWLGARPELLLAAVVLFGVLLVENSRIPIDDPNTHLELTMVHEVMVLDHGGPDFAFVLQAGALKLFVMSSLIVHVLIPFPEAGGWLGSGLLLAGELGLAVFVGVVESVMARLRLTRVPQFLVGASVLAAVGLLVAMVRSAG